MAQRRNVYSSPTAAKYANQGALPITAAAAPADTVYTVTAAIYIDRVMNGEQADGKNPNGRTPTGRVLWRAAGQTVKASELATLNY